MKFNINNSNVIFQSKTIYNSCYSFLSKLICKPIFFPTLTVAVNRYLIIKLNV